MSVRTYNPSVRVGNWQEDVALQEESLKEFQRKQANGELLINVADAVLSAAVSSHSISKSEDGFVHFGDSVVLVNPETSRSLAYAVSSFTKPSEVLSATASRETHALQRNVLTIASSGSSLEPGAILCYGSHFSLVAKDPFGKERSLRSERMSLHSGASLLSGKQAVSFVDSGDKKSHNDMWQVVCYDPQQRLETDGTPVPANTPLILRHVASNINLALLSDFAVRSQLGLEPEIVCHNFLNVHKAELPPNVWVLALEQ